MNTLNTISSRGRWSSDLWDDRLCYILLQNIETYRTISHLSRLCTVHIWIAEEHSVNSTPVKVGDGRVTQLWSIIRSVLVGTERATTTSDWFNDLSVALCGEMRRAQCEMVCHWWGSAGNPCALGHRPHIIKQKLTQVIARVIFLLPWFITNTLHRRRYLTRRSRILRFLKMNKGIILVVRETRPVHSYYHSSDFKSIKTHRPTLCWLQVHK